MRCFLLSFALMLLSTFFFYFARRSQALFARSAVVAMRSCSSLCFAHGPPDTHLHSCESQHRATRTPPARSTRRRFAAPSWRHCFCRARGPTRRFKSAKTAPPLHTLPSPVASSSRSHVSTTHAPSRRLQRVFVVCTHALRGQASRRRPTRTRVSARCAFAHRNIAQGITAALSLSDG
jgi:hypothetical protein